MTSSDCHSVKLLSTIIIYFLVAMVTDLCRHLTYDSKDAWHYSVLLLSKIRTIEKIDFLKSIIHSQIILFSVV